MLQLDKKRCFVSHVLLIHHMHVGKCKKKEMYLNNKKNEGASSMSFTWHFTSVNLSSPSNPTTSFLMRLTMALSESSLP